MGKTEKKGNWNNHFGSNGWGTDWNTIEEYGDRHEGFDGWMDFYWKVGEGDLGIYYYEITEVHQDIDGKETKTMDKGGSAELRMAMRKMVDGLITWKTNRAVRLFEEYAVHLSKVLSELTGYNEKETVEYNAKPDFLDMAFQIVDTVSREAAMEMTDTIIELTNLEISSKIYTLWVGKYRKEFEDSMLPPEQGFMG